MELYFSKAYKFYIKCYDINPKTNCDKLRNHTISHRETTFKSIGKLSIEVPKNVQLTQNKINKSTKK